MTFPIFFLVLLFSINNWTVGAVDRFSYDLRDSRNPSNWDDVSARDNEWQKWKELPVSSNECGKRSNRQSPIDLRKTDRCKFDHRIYMDRGHCSLDDIKFEITPYSLKGTYSRDCKRPAADVSNSFVERYASTFELKVPSEHTTKGRRYDAELFVSHVDNVSRSSSRDDEILMTSVLIDASDDVHSSYMEVLIKHWRKAVCLSGNRCFGVTSCLGKDRRNLENLDSPGFFVHWPFHKKYYYAYKGSLTIPPCSEIVYWFIMDEPLKISKRQLLELQILVASYLDNNCNLSTYANGLGHVNRPIQRHDKHEVHHCDRGDYNRRKLRKRRRELRKSQKNN